MSCVNLTINGLPVTVPKGTRIIDAAKKANVHIPVLCDHPDLCKRALCRICVVECDGSSKLTAACANDVWEGAAIVTHNARLLSVRKTILELILANHPQDCLVCVRNKNCELQTLAADLGIRSSPFRQDDPVQPPKRNPPERAKTLEWDIDKCIKCGRCVTACQEVKGIGAINTAHRSINYEVCTPYKEALDKGPCNFCGLCAEVCPVGSFYKHEETG